MVEHGTGLQVGTHVFAMLVLPFSLGLVHAGGGWLILLCIFAGMALAMLDYSQDLGSDYFPLQGLLDDIALRTASVALPACLSFSVASRLH